MIMNDFIDLVNKINNTPLPTGSIPSPLTIPMHKTPPGPLKWDTISLKDYIVNNGQPTPNYGPGAAIGAAGVMLPSIPHIDGVSNGVMVKYLNLVDCASKMFNISQRLNSMKDIQPLLSSQGKTAAAAADSIAAMNMFVHTFAEYAKILSDALLCMKRQFEEMDSNLSKGLSQIGGNLGVISGATTPKGNVQIIGKGETWNEYKYGDKTYSLCSECDLDSYVYYQYDKKYNGRMNVACSLCAQAVCMSIINKKPITPESLMDSGNGYWGSGGCNWKGNKGNTYGDGYKNIVDSIVTDGRPCVIELYNGSGSGYPTHYVAAVGIRDGADYNNLTTNDILCVDSATGKVSTLAECEKAQGRLARKFSGRERVIRF